MQLKEFIGGKSAILTAIVLALGGKASSTVHVYTFHFPLSRNADKIFRAKQRAANLRGFIREGQTYVYIMFWLSK
jgi:DNA repair ATPase RecN